MIALLAAALIWVGANLSTSWNPQDSGVPLSPFAERVVAGKQDTLWLAIGYTPVGDTLRWPKGQRTWARTRDGWLPALQTFLVWHQVSRGTLLGESLAEIPVARLWWKEGRGRNRGKSGATLFDFG